MDRLDLLLACLLVSLPLTGIWLAERLRRQRAEDHLRARERITEDWRDAEPLVVLPISGRVQAQRGIRLAEGTEPDERRA